MNIFRRLSTRGLLALVGAVAVAGAAAAALAVTAFGGGGSTPPAEPLAQAVHDALSAPPVEGVSADISFSNHLFDATSLGALGAASPLLSGATGRLWITNDGHLRLELQSSAGDTEIVSDGTTLSVYDGSSNTAYELPLPQASSAPAAGTTPPSVAEIESALSALAAEADVSGATPDSVAGQPAYTVTVSPKTGGGLIGGVELSWDAATGVPLRVAVTARGASAPVLELTVTDISYGPVASSDVDITPPPGANVVTLTPPASAPAAGSAAPVTGVAAVGAAVPFTLVAPGTLDGLALGDVRLTGSGSDAGALLTYGDGLGSLLVVEHGASGPSGSGNLLAGLPTVAVGGSTGHELVTPLGTVLRFERAGVDFTVAGSVTQADAESAAQALAS